ncbi:hypothetical protein [Anabaena sp. PCC 7108]|uniref:hypothetical protein n=1 Tax=Anabaena sp. PCC 7108 TaxID=163908 RepID=UPI00034A93D9|nr:hypothetical protein [Anabaena sp. PCC 7108]
MLVRNSTPTNTSPFHFKGLDDNKQQSVPQQLVQENNRERTFRRAGNACEIAAGTALNSTIIFTFHLLQVHPAGLLLAVGTCHFYFTATAVGEKSFSVAMIGCAGSLSCLCALSEPVGEWWEARTSISSASEEIQRIYQPQKEMPDWVGGIAIALLLFGVRVIFSKIFIKK